MNNNDEYWLKKANKYKQKYINLKLTQSNYELKGGANNNTKLCLFKAEWCGHCQNFKPVWKSLKSYSDFNNKIDFITYDADKNTSDIKKFNIDGFPTILLMKGGNIVQYEGSRDMDSMITFIKTYINN